MQSGHVVSVESTVLPVQNHREPPSIEALADAKRAADTLIASGVCTLGEVRKLAAEDPPLVRIRARWGAFRT